MQAIPYGGRFERNGILSAHEQDLLSDKKVLVVGCGGLGGYILEQLARLGVGSLTAMDPDVFNETNLNRQLFCTLDTLGKTKAEIAKVRLKQIAPKIHIIAIKDFLTIENAVSYVGGHDVVVDALDNNTSRLILAEACDTLNIPMVHGAIAGWYGQQLTVLPGRGTQIFKGLLSKGHDKGIEQKLGNPAFMPGLVASYQVAEVLKILICRGELNTEHLIVFDLFDNEVTYVALANPL